MGSKCEANRDIKDNNFNYKRNIIPLLKNADKTKENIILLTTGSFNPIHRMHLEILNIAYKHLLSLKKYNILCAFISPSSDCYVRNKQPPLIPFSLRCQMIQASIDEFYKENKDKEQNIVKIFIHKWEGSHNYFIDFPDVIKVIQEQLDKIGNVKLLYVCGMDHFIKCHYSLKQNVVVVERKPFNINLNNEIYKSIPNKMVFLIRDVNSKEYSSSSIRDFYKKRDYESIKKATFENVDQMIIKFYDKNKEKFTQE